MNHFLDAALDYQARGWSSIPLVPGEKRPNGRVLPTVPDPHTGGVKATWEMFIERLATKEELQEFWQAEPNGNVGIALGPVSGLVAIDIDSQEGEALFAELFGGAANIPETLEFTTPRGRRLLFADPPGIDLKTKSIKSGKKEAWKFLTKGSQTVMPPSVLQDGQEYTWVTGRRPGEIERAPCPPQLVEWLLKQQEKSPPLTNGKEDQEAPAQITTTTPILERARLYLTKCEPAVSGANGHNQTIKVADKLVVGFGLSVDDAAFLLRTEWNHRCRPPWPDKELRRKCQQALEHTSHGMGYLLDEPAVKPLTNGHRAHEKSPGTGVKQPIAPPSRKTGPDRLETVCMATIQPKPLDWEVPDLVPRAKMTLFAGDGGLGKSTLTVDIAAKVTTGRPCCGLDYHAGGPGDVLLLSCEDDDEDTIVPRLLAASADMSRCFKVKDIIDAEGNRKPFSLAHVELLRKKLQDHPDARLVVIDPVSAFLGRAGVNDHKDAEVRAVLAGVAELAATCRVAVIMVHHLSKAQNVKARARVLGSVAYVNAVRSCLLATSDPDDDSRRLLLQVKANLTARSAGLAYRLVPLTQEEQAEALAGRVDHLTAADQQRLAAQLYRVQWEGPTDITADEALAAATAASNPSKVDQAATWLRTLLAEYAFPSDEVLAAGEKAGFNRSTVFAAKKQEAIPAKKCGLHGPWIWGFQEGHWTGWKVRPEGYTPQQALNASHASNTSDASNPSNSSKGPNSLKGVEESEPSQGSEASEKGGYGTNVKTPFTDEP
jgi:hypothetical protein